MRSRVQLVYTLIFACALIGWLPFELSGQDSNVVSAHTEFLFPDDRSERNVIDRIENRRNHQQTDGLFFILLAQLLVVALITRYARRAFENQTRSVLNANLSFQIFRDTHHMATPASILLTLNFIVCLAMVVLCLVETELSQIDWNFFNCLLIIISVIYLSKQLIALIFGWIAEQSEQSRYAVFTVQQFNKTIGILLIPLLIFTLYANDPFGQIGKIFLVISVIAFVIWKVLRLIPIWNLQSARGYFYLIAYICTLELTPVVIAIKLVQSVITKV